MVKKTWIIFVFLFIIIGCQKPINAYKKSIEAVLIPTELIQVEASCQSTVLKLDEWLLTDLPAPTELTIMISDFKQQVYELNEVILQVNPLEEDLSDTHKNLIEVMSLYSEIAQRAEDITTITHDLNTLLVAVKDTNDQIMQITLSGNPTSLKYNQALSDFAKGREEELKLFDLDIAEQVLSEEQLDTVFLKDAIEKAKLTSEDIKNLEAVSETDVKVNQLLSLMYEQILGMYELALNNKDAIEWSNQYQVFDAYGNEKKELILSYLEIWQSKTGIILK